VNAEEPIRCRHCGKEIPDSNVHRELCPEQTPVNGVPLSHGLSPDDYMRLLSRQGKKPESHG